MSNSVPGRSNFVNTCNLLSRYIKEKGSLRDFNLEIDGKIARLESIMKSGSNSTASASTRRNLSTHMEKSAHLQTQLSRPGLPIMKVEDSSSKETASIEPKRDQLTIFYAGRVLVFDNCPADKAKELVVFANKGSSVGIEANLFSEKIKPIGSLIPNEETRSEGVVSLENVSGISSNTFNAVLNNGSGGTGSSPSLLPGDNGSDLPIARRSSVHRFLEKRKERAAAARGWPYHVLQDHQHQPSSSTNSDQHLDLKL